MITTQLLTCFFFHDAVLTNRLTHIGNFVLPSQTTVSMHAPKDLRS